MITIYGNDKELKTILHILEKGRMNTTRDEVDDLELDDEIKFRCVHISDIHELNHNLKIENH